MMGQLKLFIDVSSFCGSGYPNTMVHLPRRCWLCCKMWNEPYLPSSRRWYLFTDPGGMEGWV